MKSKKDEKKQKHNRLFYYGLYTIAIDGIKHFGNIQTYYRMLASKVLLGVFVVFSCIFSFELSSKALNPYWIAFVTCILGAVIITIIGYIDLVFQERSLIANFREAYDLEQQFRWLPPIHQNMLLEGKHHASSSRKSIFYIACNIILFLLATIPLFFAQIKSHHLVISLGGYALFLLIYFNTFNKVVGNFDKIFSEIENKRKIKDG